MWLKRFCFFFLLKKFYLLASIVNDVTLRPFGPFDGMIIDNAMWSVFSYFWLPTVTAFKPRFCPQSYNELYWTLLSWFSVILLKVFSFLLLQVIPLSWGLKVTTGLSVEIHGVCSWCDQALKEYVFKSKRGISFPLSYKNFWGDTSLELL